MQHWHKRGRWKREDARRSTDAVKARAGAADALSQDGGWANEPATTRRAAAVQKCRVMRETAAANQKEHAAPWARAFGGPQERLAGPGAARGGPPAARSDAPAPRDAPSPRRMPRRAQPGLPPLLIFLMAVAAVVAVAPGAPCAAPAAACVPPCAPKQCLHFLQESHKDELCDRDLSPGRRRTALANLRLRHCCEHRVAEALPEAAYHDTQTCRLHLQELLETDDLAYQASCSHSDLLLRYDCAQNYSIAFNCEHCKVRIQPI